jgi:hypothetical protein
MSSEISFLGLGSGKIHGYVTSYFEGEFEVFRTVISDTDFVGSGAVAASDYLVGFSAAFNGNGLMVLSSYEQSCGLSFSGAGVMAVPSYEQIYPLSLSGSGLLTTSGYEQDCGLSFSGNSVMLANHVIEIPSAIPAAYLAVCFSPENKAITCLSHIPFTGSCQWMGKSLFINENGLYQYGGLTDDGDTIVPSFKTAKMTQGTQHLKVIPTSKVYVNADKPVGKIELKVTADTSDFSYRSEIEHDGFRVYPFGLGRGLKFSTIQLELKGIDTGFLAIESIEFEPTTVRRRS